MDEEGSSKKRKKKREKNQQQQQQQRNKTKQTNKKTNFGENVGLKGLCIGNGFPILDVGNFPNTHSRKLLKGGLHLNAIFPPLDMALMEISRSRFKQSKNPIIIP